MISGKIISTEKEIVDFATVYLKGTTYGGTTDEQGIYHLNAPAGDYPLVVSAIGYQTVEKPVRLAGGERTKQNITITRSCRWLKRNKPFETFGIQCRSTRLERTAKFQQKPERGIGKSSGNESA